MQFEIDANKSLLSGLLVDKGKVLDIDQAVKLNSKMTSLCCSYNVQVYTKNTGW